MNVRGLSTLKLLPVPLVQEVARVLTIDLEIPTDKVSILLAHLMKPSATATNIFPSPCR